MGSTAPGRLPSQQDGQQRRHDPCRRGLPEPPGGIRLQGCRLGGERPAALLAAKVVPALPMYDALLKWPFDPAPDTVRVRLSKH